MRAAIRKRDYNGRYRMEALTPDQQRARLATHASRVRRWQLSHPPTKEQKERIKLRNRAAYAKDSTRIRAWQKAYYHGAGREKYRLWAKLDADKKRARRIADHRYWFAAVIWQIKGRARRKGMEMSITKEDLDIPEVCPVLNRPFIWDTPRHPFTPSIDRIDPTRGYTKDNIWVISCRANQLKLNATIEELEAMGELAKYLNFRKTLSKAQK